jgi:hypothetical protein
MATIMDFPVEIMAKVFIEMNVEDAWAARAACRYWHDVFELVAYGSKQSPLTGIKIGVDAVCGLLSTKGQILDRHVVHGDLSLKTNGVGLRRTARWAHEKQKQNYQYWPGGNWRKYDLVDVITDVKLHISGLPLRKQSVSLPLGCEVSIRGKTIRRENIEEQIQTGSGKFKDFVLLIDTIEESSYHGSVAIKHCINGFMAPKWQIYALLAQHQKAERELSERLHRHYVQSYHNSYSHVMAKPKIPGEKRARKICSVTNSWVHLPPRWTIEC